MRRRDVLLALAALPALASAQNQPARIGLLWLGAPEFDDLRKALFAGLRDNGYVEGRNLTIEDRTGAKRYEELVEGARDLVRLKVDVILTFGATAARAARDATTTIPVVVIAGGDPVKQGLAKSHARPGGNVTGISTLSAELHGKHVQLLRDTLPQARLVAAIVNPTSDAGSGYLAEVQKEGRRAALEFRPFEVRAAEDLETAFAAAAKAHVNAVFVVPATMLSTQRRRVAQLALKHRLPCFGYSAEFAEAGALLGYGISRQRIFRRAADYIDRILKGASPAEMPIEWPAEFELVVNLRTAKALGLTIPPAVLLSATRTIV